MAFNWSERFKSLDKEHNKHSDAIRKSILRNPEVPIRQNEVEPSSDSRKVSFIKFTAQDSAVERYQGSSSQAYHKPRPNMMNQMCENLKELKMSKPQPLGSLSELPKESQYVANREITAKLNYPSHQKIYKDLTKLDDDPSAEVARKTDKLIQKTAKKILDKSSMHKSQEIREEITSLINKLVELEYSEADKVKVPKVIPLPSEDDYLGFSKFSAPNIFLPNKRTETQRYMERLDEEIEHELNKANAYLESQSWVVAENNQIANSENNCKCLSEFYEQHSTCS